MAVTLEYPLTFVVITCSECAIQFGLPVEMQARRQRSGGVFYCPNGHAQEYSTTTEHKLRKELEQAKGKLANVQFELIAEQAARIATEAKLKRAKKRVANRTCPCCKRQFVSLQRHMKSQHPEYGSDQ